MSKQLFEKDLTDDQEEEVLAQFAALDPEKKGQIEWSDFLYHESLSVLQKFRTEVWECQLVYACAEMFIKAHQTLVEMTVLDKEKL